MWHFTKFTEKILSLLITSQAFRPAILLKRDTCKCVFPWNLGKSLEDLLWRVCANGCFWKVLMTNFNSTLDNFIKNYISLAVLRIEGFAEGAPRKELIIVPFLKRFKAANLWRPHWPILTVLLTVLISVLIAFILYYIFKICQYFRLHMKIIRWKFHIKTPFTFWDMHLVIWEKFVYKHSETIEFAKNLFFKVTNFKGK